MLRFYISIAALSNSLTPRIHFSRAIITYTHNFPFLFNSAPTRRRQTPTPPSAPKTSRLTSSAPPLQRPLETPILSPRIVKRAGHLKSPGILFGPHLRTCRLQRG